MQTTKAILRQTKVSKINQIGIASKLTLGDTGPLIELPMRPWPLKEK